MLIGGLLWVDAGTPRGEVIAYIDGVECGRTDVVVPVDGGPIFLISIKSDHEKTRCGTPGAGITITLNGRPMNDTLEWRPGYQPSVTLFAGPVPARYYGEVRFDAPFTSSDIWPRQVVPYIDGVVCGGQQDPMQGNGQVGYVVVVTPEELKPGCGRDGAIITLRLEVMVAGTPVEIDLQDVTWQPGPIVQLGTIDIASSSLLPVPPTTAPGQ
jgi:hypothetical protein